MYMDVFLEKRRNCYHRPTVIIFKVCSFSQLFCTITFFSHLSSFKDVQAPQLDMSTVWGTGTPFPSAPHMSPLSQSPPSPGLTWIHHHWSKSLEISSKSRREIPGTPQGHGGPPATQPLLPFPNPLSRMGILHGSRLWEVDGGKELGDFCCIFYSVGRKLCLPWKNSMLNPKQWRVWFK